MTAAHEYKTPSSDIPDSEMSDPAPSITLDMITKARCGDIDSLNALAFATLPLTRSAVFSSKYIGENGGEGEDIVYAVWGHVVLKTMEGKYAPQPGKTYDGWAFVVAANAVRDIRRQRIKLASHETPDTKWITSELALLSSTADTPVEALERSSERRIAALFAVAGVSRIRAEIARMCKADGLTYEMIAEKLKIPVGTVKSNVHYAMTRVRAYFNIEEGKTPRRNLFEELYRPDSYRP